MGYLWHHGQVQETGLKLDVNRSSSSTPGLRKRVWPGGGWDLSTAVSWAIGPPGLNSRAQEFHFHPCDLNKPITGSQLCTGAVKKPWAWGHSPQLSYRGTEPPSMATCPYRGGRGGKERRARATALYLNRSREASGIGSFWLCLSSAPVVNQLGDQRRRWAECHKALPHTSAWAATSSTLTDSRPTGGTKLPDRHLRRQAWAEGTTIAHAKV